MKQHKEFVVRILGLSLLIFAAGCRKKAPAPPPPPPAPKTEVKAQPNAPTISEFVAEPSWIERGQSALLRWRVNDATDISINQGVGVVPPAGERRVSPNEATTYTLTAKGPGGETSAKATIDVVLPAVPPSPEQPKQAPLSFQERLSGEVQDAYFDFDRSDVRKDATAALATDAEKLKAIFRDFPNFSVVIEGHCDERGSAEYNIGLGDRRASAAKQFLSQVGVPAERVITISYGKERPQCTESNETCWQKNRRVHFAPGEEQKPKLLSDETDTNQNP